MKQEKLYNVAIYCRLSLDDGNEGDSSSIKTQRLMLEEYAKEKGFNIYYYYINDGYSKNNFDRPNFQKLMNDIKLGKIGVIITKDLSRLDRDHINTEYLLENYFPENRVVFIAINDDVDTEKRNNRYHTI